MVTARGEAARRLCGAGAPGSALVPWASNNPQRRLWESGDAGSVPGRVTLHLGLRTCGRLSVSSPRLRFCPRSGSRVGAQRWGAGAQRGALPAWAHLGSEGETQGRMSLRNQVSPELQAGSHCPSGGAGLAPVVSGLKLVGCHFCGCAALESPSQPSAHVPGNSGDLCWRPPT